MAKRLEDEDDPIASVRRKLVSVDAELEKFSALIQERRKLERALLILEGTEDAHDPEDVPFGPEAFEHALHSEHGARFPPRALPPAPAPALAAKTKTKTKTKKAAATEKKSTVGSEVLAILRAEPGLRSRVIWERVRATRPAIIPQAVGETLRRLAGLSAAAPKDRKPVVRKDADHRWYPIAPWWGSSEDKPKEEEPAPPPPPPAEGPKASTGMVQGSIPFDVLKYIEEHPGCNSSEVLRALKKKRELGNEDAVHGAIYKLAQSKRIQQVGPRHRRLLYPIGVEAPETSPILLPKSGSIAEVICTYLKDKGGPARRADIVKHVRKVKPDASDPSIATQLYRLAGVDGVRPSSNAPARLRIEGTERNPYYSLIPMEQLQLIPPEEARTKPPPGEATIRELIEEAVRARPDGIKMREIVEYVKERRAGTREDAVNVQVYRASGKSKRTDSPNRPPTLRYEGDFDPTYYPVEPSDE